jgi:sucrose-6-phosphate hydrolase SacC (GH32 family)
MILRNSPSTLRALLLFAIPTAALTARAAPAAGMAPVTLQLTASSHYLEIPVVNEGPLSNVAIAVAGDIKQNFRIRLADGKPDWWGVYNIGPYQGQPMTLTADALPAGSKGLSRIYQTDHPVYPADLYHEPLRPRFHFSPKQGWNNDANGLVYYEGEYHLFYQYSPFSLRGGENVGWGHAVSPDLVHWKELDVAIYPFPDGDIWSGSAVIDWKNTTGFGKDGKPPMVAMFTKAGRPFTQCIAYSTDNGRTFTKYAGNPVVQNVVAGDRDPKIFWDAPIGQWVLAFFLGIRSDVPPHTEPHWTSIITIRNSPDLKHWTEKGVVESDPECPDLFSLPLDGNQGNRKWILEAADGSYQVGSFNGGYFVPETPKLPSRYNAGLYYAAQTFTELPKGDKRCIQMVWIRVSYPGMNFTQAISIPIELTLRTTDEGPRMCSWPVRELDTLRTGTPVIIKDQPLKPGEDALAHVENKPLDLDVDIDPAKSAGFELTVQGTPIRYDAARSALSCLDVTSHILPEHGHVHIRVLSDVNILEIFPEGHIMIPQVLDPNRPNPGAVGLRSLGGEPQVHSLEMHYLRSIWD